MRRLTLLLLLILLGACSLEPSMPERAMKAVYDSGIGLVKLILDPLAPNWEIEESRLAEDTYRYELRMKRFNTGGAGEAMQILRRRATQLQRERGYGGYELLEYTEGIESLTFGSQRVAEATVRLTQPPAKAGASGKSG